MHALLELVPRSKVAITPARSVSNGHSFRRPAGGGCLRSRHPGSRRWKASQEDCAGGRVQPLRALMPTTLLKKFGFQYCTTDESHLIQDSEHQRG